MGVGAVGYYDEFTQYFIITYGHYVQVKVSNFFTFKARNSYKC